RSGRSRRGKRNRPSPPSSAAEARRRREGPKPLSRLAGGFFGGFLLLLLLGEVLRPKPFPNLVEFFGAFFELIPGVLPVLEFLQAPEINPNLVGGNLRSSGLPKLFGQVLRGDDLLLRGLLFGLLRDLLLRGFLLSQL